MDTINDFYGDSFLDIKVKDPFKYRGIGRPRNIDYSSIIEVNREYLSKLNEYLDLKIKSL